jgi:threonine dehydratase
VTGSFKARGAMNRLLGTPGEAGARGIVTASGGNHGLAVARTAFAPECRRSSSCRRAARRKRSTR